MKATSTTLAEQMCIAINLDVSIKNGASLWKKKDKVVLYLYV